MKRNVTCTDCGQDKKHHARGLCSACYSRRDRDPAHAWAPISGPTLRDRLFSGLVINHDSGCLVWTGCDNGQGYGVVTVDGRNQLVHRLMWLMFEEPIPEGQQLDHLCHTRDLACREGDSCPHRRCANVSHLEVVTPAENTRRGGKSRITHCPKGHRYSEDNTYLHRGHRECRTCVLARNEAARQRRIERSKREAAA